MTLSSASRRHFWTHPALWAGALVAIAAAVAIILAFPPPQAHAVTIGIGDNGPAMFQDPRYQSLKTKIARKIVPYDYYHYKAYRQDLDAWLAGARANGVQPLIAFNHSDRHPRKLPSVGEYQKSLRYLLRTHPEVRTISPWNEANHVTQPTYKNPMRAAQYYNTTRKICRGCKIVAADVLDQTNMLPWIAEFRKTAYKPSVWGLHSYADVNHKVSWSKSAAKKLLSAVPGKIWLTEVGGLVAFKYNFRPSLSRAANGTSNTLRLAHRSSRIQRLYIYSWFGTPHNPKAPYRWDSGLVGPGVGEAATSRPAYFRLKAWLEKHPRDRG